MPAAFQTIRTLFIIAVVLAIISTILLFIFIVPEKKKNRLNGFGKFLHNTFNFKYLIVEKILQALYIFSTCFIILLGFVMLFCVVPDYFGDGEWLGGKGILIMILGPIAVRLVYEFLMMAILLIKNVIQINNKLKAASNNNADDIFATPSINLEGMFTKDNKAPDYNNGYNPNAYNPNVYNNPNAYNNANVYPNAENYNNANAYSNANAYNNNNNVNNNNNF